MAYNSRQATCRLFPQGPFPSLHIRAQSVSPPPSSLPLLPLWCSCFCFKFTCAPVHDPSLSYMHFEIKLMRYYAGGKQRRHCGCSWPAELFCHHPTISQFRFFKQTEMLPEKVWALYGGWVYKSTLLHPWHWLSPPRTRRNSITDLMQSATCQILWHYHL